MGDVVKGQQPDQRVNKQSAAYHLWVFKTASESRTVGGLKLAPKVKIDFEG